MLDIGHDFKQIHPNWFDTMRVTKLPVVRESSSARTTTPSPACARAAWACSSSTPTDGGRAEDHLRVRAVRHRRGRRADHVPPAPRLRRARRVRRRPDLEPIHGSRTCSRTRSNTGGRPAWCSSATCRSAGCRDRGEHSNLTLALERPGASGDQGVYADRVEFDGIKARFPLPDFSGAYKYSGGWGYMRAAGIYRKINWDDTLDDRRFDFTESPTGGAQPQLESEAGREDDHPDAVRVRRRHPELHERRASRYRHRNSVIQPVEHDDADPRRAAADRRRGAVPRSQLRNENSAPASATR